jgi:peptidoglycan/LPS O-acetylase OafA/YrhL
MPLGYRIPALRSERWRLVIDPRLHEYEHGRISRVFERSRGRHAQLDVPWRDSEAGKASFSLNVQGCRGLFAAMVLVHHVQHSGLGSGAFWSNPVSMFYFMGFQYAVELFFCISGYVISVPLTQASSAQKFLGDRLLRLMPVFLVIHLLLFTLGPVFQAQLFVDVGFWAWCKLFVTNLLLLPGVFHFPAVQPQAWSLSYEMLCYVLGAIYYFHGHRIARTPRLVLTTFVLVLLFNRYPRAIFFSIGVIARHAEPLLRRQRWSRVSPLVYLVLMLTCWQSIDYLSGMGAIDHMRLVDWLFDGRIVLAIAAYAAGLAFFVSMLRDEGVFGRVMRSRVFQHLGVISYSFYLWHPLIMFGVKRALRSVVLPYTGDVWGKTLFFLVSAGMSLMAAHVSYRLIEQRLTSYLKSRFAAPDLDVEPLRLVADAGE